MASSRCAPDPRSGVWARLLACLLSIGLMGGAVAAGEGVSPWRGEARIELGAGYAGEARYDPLLDLAAVPGGGFAGLSPWGRVRRPVGARGSGRAAGAG